jgi:hypothetical protein
MVMFGFKDDAAIDSTIKFKRIGSRTLNVAFISLHCYAASARLFENKLELK